MTTSTSFAQMANNQSISLSSALCANTPPTKGQTPSRKFLTLSIFFLLSFFCTTHTWGADTWTLVTNVSDLATDDEVVIVANGAAQALSTTQNDNNRGQAAITKSQDKSTVETPSNSVQILTLKAGKNTGTFAFYTGSSGYLYAASSSKNYLRTETTLSSNSSWSITITSAGVATIKAQGTNTHNWLRYNSSSSIFSCYSSGQGDVCIYKKVTPVEPQTIDVTLHYNGIEETLSNKPSPYTLPTTGDYVGDACDGWEFAGWYGSEYAKSAAKPTYITQLTSTRDAYAVYSHTETTEGGGSTTEETTETYTFSNYTAGTQYAKNEVHKLDDNVTLTTTDCHFTSELRIYSSSTNNGYVVSNQLPGRIISIGFNAGNKVDKIAVYGSTAGDAWTKVGQVSVTSTSYKDYTLSFDENNYTYFKLDVEGSNQVRLKSMTITWESTTGGGSTTYYSTTPECTTETSVTLNPNGGSFDSKPDGWEEDGNNYKKEGVTGAITLPTPTKTGYNFDGWYDDEIKVNNSSYTPSKTVTLVAKWTANTYTIDLDNQGATTAGAASVTAAYDAAMPSIASNLPQKTGYTFNGYFDAVSGGTQYYKADGTSAKNWDKTAATTLYAQWTLIEYTLSLESTLKCVDNGSITIAYKATSAKTFTPATRDDYTCTGYWSAPSGGVQVLNADGSFAGNDVNDFITDGKWINTTATKLTPRWETEYKMILSKGTEENGTYTLSPTTIETSSCATLTTRQVTITATPNTGYEVDQITYSGAGTATPKSGPTLGAGKTTWVYTFAENDKGTGTFTVTFKSLPKYTVSFSTGTGNPTQADIAETNANAGITLPIGPTPTCTDWDFAGWAEESVSTETTTKPTLFAANSSYKPTSNITLYAVYQRTEGGGGNTTGSKTFTLSTIASANGWENGVAYTSIKDDPVTIVAEGGGNNGKWYTSSNGSWRMYSGGTVRIAADGGIITSVTSTPSCTFTINNGEATFSPSARTDFTNFVVEYSVAGGSTTYYHSTPDCGTPEPLPTYTITWMANGQQYDSQTDEEGKTIILPTNPDASTYACDGKVFVGWTATEIDGKTDAEPADLFNTINETIASDKTFFAVFAKPETVGSAETTVTTQISTYADKNYWENGTKYTTVTLDGYITATATGSGNTGKYYESGETWRLYKSENATITISASNGCTINTVTITYDSEKNGVLLNAGTQVASGDEITVNAESLTLGTGVSSGAESGQVRITQISVTYTSTGGGSTSTYSNYVTTCDNTEYTLTLIDRGVRTEQTTKYHAGETIDEAPVAPTGVCTDPINYVFYGWTTEEIATSASSCTKVSFPYTVTGDTEFYAVYRWNESNGGDGDYHLVEEDMDDWSGDYLIAYSDAIFANGSEGGKEGIGANGTHVDLSSRISNKSIPHEEGDKYNVTLESTTDGYLMLTKDGQYNYHTTNTGNGLSNSESKTVAEKYPITVTFVSSENIQLTVAGGAVFQYNPDQQGYFRFYKNGGQKSVHLYKKTSGTSYYTTSPICGPHMEITAGKDIYVTGGIGTRNVVIASQKVSYVATRLNDNGGNAPAITATSSNSEVIAKVDNDAVITLQPDGTYTISGTITVTYIPTSTDKTADVQVQLNVENNAEATNSFTVHARSLPQEFVIVAKQGEKWYALNADMSGSTTQLANGQVTLDIAANPTKATYAPCNAIYSFEALPNSSKADRTSVRFVGLEGKYLWAASDGNTGIQNYSKDPAGDATAYNWKLYTTDHITYQMGNGQNTRLLGLNSSLRFGMYSSVAGLVNDIRILPYVEKCVYNQAPSNLKITDLKGTYVTLVWDAVAGATKYQYSTDATNWTDCGTEPTVTINGLTGNEEYTYYIRAYHEDAGVNQVCIDYSEITFTTANCDDVPANITYTADLNSITVSWTAAAPTATIKLFMNEDGTGGGGTYPGAISPYKISGGLDKNTTYYIQILADGTCASPIIPVKTEDVKVDVVEWLTDGIIVDINTNEKISVTLANEVQYGTGSGNKAEDIFFSKYFEANGTAKILAIYNGTDQKIDITNITILNDLNNQSLSLETFGRQEEGYIYPGEEIILFNKGTEAVTDCSEKQEGYENWYNVEHGVLNFGGRATLILKRGDVVIDIIGSIETQGTNYPNDLLGTTIYNIAKYSTGENEKPSWGDDPGWVCENGDNIKTDIVETDYGLSTNRCLLVRKNTVVSGDNAVKNNINKAFVTLCDEWIGLQIPLNAPSTDKGVTESCEGMAFVGGFDYAGYYTKYETVGGAQEFDENARNADGTVTIPITNLYKQSCRNIRITLEDKDGNVLSNREYKVPIMITTTQGTDGQAFIDLRHNLATKIDDGNGGLIDQDLTYEEVLEICKTCDVVIRDNATLQKMADDAENDHPQVRDIYVYENSSLIVPNGTNYTINNLSLRRKEDAVASVSAYPEALMLPESAAAPISLDFRLSAKSWHWFTLPYDCKISEVTWVDGSPAQYNVDWFLMTYDGEKRAATQAGGCWKAHTGTTIKAGEGFILAINGNINNPAHTYELRFPMSKDVLVAEGIDKTVDVRAWGVETNIRPNHKGWNLVGNPYLAYYLKDNINSFEGLRLGELVGPNPQTGYWTQTGDVPYVVVPIGAGYEAYEQLLASETDLLPFTAYFVQVGNDGTHNSSQDLKVSFDHTKLQLSATPMPASIVRRAPSEVNETEEPVIVGVALTNSLGESDKTSLVIADRFTNEYEMQADFFKWFGDYYNYYTKPVLYTIGADQGKRAFNALNEELAAQPIPMGMYAAQAGNYTFSLNQQFDLSRVEEVWLYDATQSTYTNLMQSDYTFSTSKVNGAGRFSLSVKLAPKVATSIDNVTADKVWATTQNQQIIVNGLENGMYLWLYDATGKLLYNEPTSNYQHTYLVPQTGTYFVSVMNRNQKQTIKVVVE